MIYVGKAVSFRDRVRSYFQQQGRFTSPKVKAMVEHIADVEYIVTDSEVEALILEATLIKEKAPRYNVRLKDDKSYPYLKVTDEPFPRVVVVRRPGKDGRYSALTPTPGRCGRRWLSSASSFPCAPATSTFGGTVV